MNYRLLLAIIAGFLYSTITSADPLITFSFKPYTLNLNAPARFVMPEKTTLTQIEKLFSPLVAGIPLSYGGYLTVSDLQGDVSLPRKHEKPIVRILITSRITPMIMGGLTVHHWEREEGTLAAIYTAERRQDPKTKKFEWSVQQEPLPKSMVIKPATIIIFVDPASIVVPTGIFPTVNQPNLHLPDMYVKDEIVINQRSLYLLNIKQFFGPLKGLFQKKPLLYQKHLDYEKH